MADVRKTRRARQLAIDAGLVALAAVGILTVVYRLWDASLGIPFVYLQPDAPPLTYAPDAPFYLMITKGAIDHGWFLTNPSLGFPFRQELHEFPQGLDNLNLVILQGIGWITGNAFTTVNLFFLLTFLTVSVAAFLVARRLGCSRLVSATVALLYTFLPYHFARGTPHLFLSAYWVVPVAALLLVRVVSAAPPFTVERDTERGWRISLRGRTALVWLLGCAALASTGSYYAAITLTLLVAVVIVDFVARRRTRVLASGAVAAAAIVAVMLFNLVPTFVYWAEHGRNENLVQRGTSETEVNGLKISQLVLPVEDHRLAPLAEIQADSTRFSVIPAERGQQLGAIGAAGFLVVVGSVLVVARRRLPAPEPPETDPRAGAGPGSGAGEDPTRGADAVPAPAEVIRVFGIATLVGILIAAVSGLSLVISGIGIKEIRSWNRVSVFIGFFALVTVGFGLDWLRRRLPHRSWVRPATAAALAGLVLIGVLDQVSPEMTPHYRETRRQFESDQAFFREVEDTLPRGAAVFNLPYVFFPESGTVEGVGPYDTARGYLHTRDLRWSWGGVVGTDADWAAGAAQGAGKEMLDRITALGFRGLVYDRRGYGGNSLREYFLAQLIGTPPLVSPDEELAFYDLRPWAAAARRRLGADGMRAKAEAALRDHGRPRSTG